MINYQDVDWVYLLIAPPGPKPILCAMAPPSNYFIVFVGMQRQDFFESERWIFVEL